MCEILWPATIPGATIHERKEALATAQGILVASEITLPTGDLSDGAYDRFGNLYKLPEHVIADPTNLVREDEQLNRDKAVSGEESEAIDEDEMLRRREEKGKAIALEEEDLVRLRAKMSEGIEKLDLKVGKNDTVKTVARRIHQKGDVSNLFF